MNTDTTGDSMNMDDNNEDRWAPVKDAYNDWIQTRFYNDERESVGNTHIEMGWGAPGWGLSGSVYTTAILCDVSN